MQQEAARGRWLERGKQLPPLSTGKLSAAPRTSQKLSHTHIFTFIKYLSTKEDLLCDYCRKDMFRKTNMYFTWLSWVETAASEKSHMASGQSRDPGGAPAAGDQSPPGSELPSLNLPATPQRSRELDFYWTFGTT